MSAPTREAVIRMLEDAFLDRLEVLRTRLSADFPRCAFNVWSSPVGSTDDHDGWDVGLDCVFTDVAPEQSRCVVLSVGVMHLGAEPMVSNAGVDWCWGLHPGVTLDLMPEAVRFGDSTLQELAGQWPRLQAVFADAVRAGCAASTHDV